MQLHLLNRVKRLAQEVAIDPDNIGTMSAGEAVAAALLNGRLDLLSSRFQHPLDAIERLDGDWLAAVREVHHSGWK